MRVLIRAGMLPGHRTECIVLVVVFESGNLFTKQHTVEIANDYEHYLRIEFEMTHST